MRSSLSDYYYNNLLSDSFYVDVIAGSVEVWHQGATEAMASSSIGGKNSFWVCDDRTTSCIFRCN